MGEFKGQAWRWHGFLALIFHWLELSSHVPTQVQGRGKTVYLVCPGRKKVSMLNHSLVLPYTGLFYNLIFLFKKISLNDVITLLL